MKKILYNYDYLTLEIELINKLALRDKYQMQLFDLVDKGEFIFNTSSNDCYMNVIDECIDRIRKKVYSTITITDENSPYDNQIIDENKVLYYT